MYRFLISVFVGVVGSPLWALPITEVEFFYKDWAIQCYDNGACIAHSGDDVKVELSRHAGPNQAVSGRVISRNNEFTGLAAVLHINGEPAGALQLSAGQFLLSASQVASVLAALKQDQDTALLIGDKRYRLSTAGSNAVLLKMDEFQGRLNTTGALIQPGNKDESTVPTAPVVKTAAEMAVIDTQALLQLHAILENLQQQDPELLLSSLDSALNQLQVSQGITHFSLDYDSNQPLSRKKPVAEITDDEWQAFLRTDLLTAAGEATKADFSLIDLNGDGRRDLIIESYIGGTGLFSYTGVLKRGKNRFYSTNPGPQADEMIPGGFFSQNGRGANQHSWWITLLGQVYAVWLDGHFSMERLYLLRPFLHQQELPVITVRYQYNMQLQQQWHENSPTQHPQEQQQLLQAIAGLPGKFAIDTDSRNVTGQAICPVPEGTNANLQQAYYAGRPMHYSMEQVGLIPVWIANQCYIGTVASFFGSYTPKAGTSLEIAIDSPRAGEQTAIGYTFSGLRQVVSVTSGIAVRTGDNGIGI
ncbi:DUF1176 domain-containing protein [Rheinheimera hassiensis]|uniref:DUF1176 domain-containing protein n=1 Tax=Rheinheimera hassiensis TaxID=1193627 RepID=UPI001F051329|nr:DUF1176 domain-containing protein [Rheinheimera hassiensis]